MPVRNQLRKQFADKPVVFIAVNSGNPKSAVEGYAKETKFEWPILVDEHNETEKEFGFAISLQNIMQWVFFDAEGKRAGFGNPADKINSLLPGARWTFAGITVPEKLKGIGRDIEFGQYDPAVGDLAAAAQKGGKDVQEPAKAMFDKIKSIAEEGLEKAKAFEGDGKKYSAYREYVRVATWFRRTEYEKSATAAMAELKKDKEVQDEVAAKGMLDQAKSLLSSGKKSDQPAAQGMLQALQKKYPNTEAAKEAASVK